MDIINIHVIFATRGQRVKLQGIYVLKIVTVSLIVVLHCYCTTRKQSFIESPWRLRHYTMARVRLSTDDSVVIFQPQFRLCFHMVISSVLIDVVSVLEKQSK